MWPNEHLECFLENLSPWRHQNDFGKQPEQTIPMVASTGSPGSLLGGISPSCLHPVSGHKPLSSCQIQNWMMIIIIISIAASLGFTHFPWNRSSVCESLECLSMIAGSLGITPVALQWENPTKATATVICGIWTFAQDIPVSSEPPSWEKSWMASQHLRKLQHQ